MQGARAGALSCRDNSVATPKEASVIGFAITLLIIAAVAAILGFSGIAGTLANVAIIIFVLALIAGIVLFILGKKAAKSLSR